jgi:putative tricarboxylic transport membrane protein
MSSGGEGRPAFGHKSAEIVVSALFLALGALVMWDSVRLGARWASDGPEAGYFPFYVALLMSIASAVNLVLAVVKKGGFRSFVGRDQLKLVLSVLVPSILYVGAIAMLGIYVASTVFIAFFMRWLGKYPWWKVVVVSVATSVVFFLIFESWFKVPLPKGRLEALLGID